MKSSAQLWQGNLENHSLLEVLGLIYAQNLSGILSLRFRRAEYKMFFLNGTPVYARSSLSTDNIFELMVSLGELEREDVPRLKKMLEEGKDPDRALLEMGVVNSTRLYHLKQLLCREIIIRACSQKQGEYYFQPDTSFSEHIPLYDLSPMEIIYEAINRFYLPRLPEMLEKFKGKLVLLNPQIEKLERLPEIFYQRIYLLDYFQKPLSLDEAVGIFLNEFQELNQAFTFFYLMLVTGVIKIKEPEKKISAEPPREEKISFSPEQEKRETPPEPALEEKEPASEIASDYIIVQKRKEKPKEVIIENSAEPGEEAESVKPAPKEAQLDLIRKLELLESWVSSSADYFQMLGVTPEASIAELEDAYIKILGKYKLDELLKNGEPELKERADKMRQEIRQAVTVLSNPLERDKYEKSLYRLELKKAWKLEQKKELAERQFRRGKWFLTHNHPQLALERFEQAIELNPEKAESFAYTGWALYCAGKELAEAEGYLRQALRLDPSSDQAYYFLGLLKKREGDSESAYQYFQKAFSLNPKNRGASREMKILEAKKKSEGIFQKIFSRK